MGLVEIVMTVCALTQPVCEEQHLQLNWQGSLAQCAMSAPPYIAQWVNEHPKWTVTRWRCDYPGRNSST